MRDFAEAQSLRSFSLEDCRSGDQFCVVVDLDLPSTREIVNCPLSPQCSEQADYSGTSNSARIDTHLYQSAIGATPRIVSCNHSNLDRGVLLRCAYETWS